MLNSKISDFNKFFSSISNLLYNEEYILTYDISKDKKTGNKKIIFKTISTNLSSGKKQGEALAFDLAYIEYAKNENIPHLSFLLNDKKELMHNNQLLVLKEYCDTHPVQVVFSILKDKLPDEIIDEKYIILKLTQEDKLFRIESQFND